ncbi:MAG TPA: leucyl aminopeptidase family protein [Bacteroidales bacterium]|jgi:leucyl aminopeptidase|nr:leucyl aminopeptidase family protein [Bacteroidales bacterium]HQB36834.1 leucyl aminopeptidase family protein [Bacteroidales bacterium]
MKPNIFKISQISPGQSVVCIVGKAEIPDMLKLTKAEKAYALKQLKAGEENVFINSYTRCTYIVRVKNEKSHFRTREELRKSASDLKKLIKSNNHSELVITSHEAYKEAIGDFTEGLILGSYSFDKYKTKKEKSDKNKSYPSKLMLLGDLTEAEIQWLNDLTDAVYFARDLINEPVGVLNAEAFASEVEKIGSKGGFKVDILRKGKIEALKMGGLLAVNKGSVDPPVFCVLEWNPARKLNSKPIVFIGKGIVYDTGGLNIKPDNYMALMKGDMAGAAAVAGVFYTAARNKIPLHIMGFLPVTDNRPGGNAYTQGDIITMYNGMTVEVGNTDAEGRLILADAISYASKYEPELIINIATLTGSAAATFGIHAIAMMTNADRKYISLLEECGNEVHERIAELPLWDDYSEMIKSDFADIMNIGGREAGAITAGKFIEKFTEYPLIHLDIAGTGLLKKDDSYRLKDGPASGLRLLATFLKEYARNYNKMK